LRRRFGRDTSAKIALTRATQAVPRGKKLRMLAGDLEAWQIE